MAFLGFGKKKAPEKFNLKDYLSDEETRKNIGSMIFDNIDQKQAGPLSQGEP